MSQTSDVNFVQQLKNRGWSENNIAHVIGSNRPALHNYLLDNKAEKLNREQFARLDVLVNAHGTYKEFIDQAIEHYAWETVYRPAYEHLAQTERKKP